VVADGLSSLGTIGVMVGIGYTGGHSLEIFRKDITRLEHAAVVLVLAMLTDIWYSGTFAHAGICRNDGIPYFPFPAQIMSSPLLRRENLAITTASWTPFSLSRWTSLRPARREGRAAGRRRSAGRTAVLPPPAEPCLLLPPALRHLSVRLVAARGLAPAVHVEHVGWTEACRRTARPAPCCPAPSRGYGQKPEPGDVRARMDLEGKGRFDRGLVQLGDLREDRLQVAVGQLLRTAGVEQHAGAEQFGQHQRVARLGVAVRQHLVRMHHTVTARPYLGSRSSTEWPRQATPPTPAPSRIRRTACL